MQLLSSLNSKQSEAVTTTQGPVLILAGAGSGKTRVIIHRIAYLIQNLQVSPQHILAVTFTNKAAKEMQERLKQLCPTDKQAVQLSTFHALGVRILREFIHHLGYRKQFIIYDSQDQLSLIKTLMEEYADEDAGGLDAKGVHFEICSAKAARQAPEHFLLRKHSRQSLFIGKIFQEYQNIMKGCNAIDFEDILSLTLTLFEQHSGVMEAVQKRFRYIMVDEYQDTNRTQYQLLRFLTRYYSNLCVVGDDDQSVYGWRGADIQNILGLEKDYPNVKTIRLEQNYRSTQLILDAANQVIANNVQRMPKKLWTQKQGNVKLEWIEEKSEAQEIESVTRRIHTQKQLKGRKYSDFSILYRSNFQARVVEEALRDAGIPYHVIGATGFYDRKEVRDALAYLKVIHNPNDEVSLHRILNYPRRGIGNSSLLTANRLARSSHKSLFAIAAQARSHKKISSTAAYGMEMFVDLIRRYQERFQNESLGTVFRDLIEEVGLLRTLEKEKSDVKARERRINCVHELMRGMDKYAEVNNRTLATYLERLALYTQQDDEELTEPQVSLLTLHSAKGLEFPCVFMVGMSDGLFPNKRALDEDGENEERRLCYVGITRAKEELTFSMAKERRRYKETIKQKPSRFLLEIDPALFKKPIVGKRTATQEKEAAQSSRSAFFDSLRPHS